MVVSVALCLMYDNPFLLLYYTLRVWAPMLEGYRYALQYPRQGLWCEACCACWTNKTLECCLLVRCAYSLDLDHSFKFLCVFFFSHWHACGLLEKSQWFGKIDWNINTYSAYTYILSTVRTVYHMHACNNSWEHVTSTSHTLKLKIKVFLLIKSHKLLNFFLGFQPGPECHVN